MHPKSSRCDRRVDGVHRVLAAQGALLGFQDSSICFACPTSACSPSTRPSPETRVSTASFMASRFDRFRLWCLGIQSVKTNTRVDDSDSEADPLAS